MTTRFFRCIDCDEIICFTPYDNLPEYEFNKEENDFVEIYSNDRTYFINEHAKHRVEELMANRYAMVSEGRYDDPMKEIYFEATNGRENFVIRKWRENADSPCNYKLFRGKIKFETEKIEPRSKEIKKQMEFDFKKIFRKKIDLFVSDYESLVSSLGNVKVEENIEFFEEESPLTGFGRLNDFIISELIRIAEKIFSKNELNDIKKFIGRNNDFDGVITLRVKRKFEIRETERKMGEILQFPPKEELIDIRKVG